MKLVNLEQRNANLSIFLIREVIVLVQRYNIDQGYMRSKDDEA